MLMDEQHAKTGKGHKMEGTSCFLPLCSLSLCPQPGKDRHILQALFSGPSTRARPNRTGWDQVGCCRQGRDTLHPWPGLPIISVVVGTHVCCLLRDRRRTAIFLSRTRRLRAKLVPRWENPWFSI